MRAVTHPCFLSFQFGLVPSLLSKAGFLPDIPMATVFPNSTYAATTLPALPSDKRDKNIYFIIFLVSIQRNGFHFNLFVPYKSLYSGIFVCCCFSLLFFFSETESQSILKPASNSNLLSAGITGTSDHMWAILSSFLTFLCTVPSFPPCWSPPVPKENPFCPYSIAFSVLPPASSSNF